jgi:hypothetical protein
MSLADVPADRRCNARTRAGHPCKNWGILPAGRCRMHGGKSWRGYASPRYRHGYYSRDILCRVMWDAVRRGDPLAQGFVENLRRRGI